MTKMRLVWNLIVQEKNDVVKNAICLNLSGEHIHKCWLFQGYDKSQL